MSSASGARRAALLLLALLSLLAAAPTDAERTLQQDAAIVAAPTLALNATRLAAAGDWLLVSWSGVADSSASDFLALLPDGGTLDTNSPLKLKPTGGTQDGNASFRMLNLRGAYRWFLYRGGLLSPHLLTQSDVLTWRDSNEPTSIHLALTGGAGEMQVQWTTHDESRPVVYWGEAGGPYTHSADATTSALRRSDLCGDAVVSWTPSRPNELTSNASGWGYVDPGVQHNAVMTGLRAGVRYAYAVGNVLGPKSAQWSFVAPPGRNASATLRFLAVADMGVAEVDGSNWDDSGAVAPLVELSMRGFDNRPARNTTARLAEEVDAGAQVLLLNGDISYARGYGGIWESFMDAMQPVAARVAAMTVPGNHESDWPGVGSAWNTGSLDSGGECGVVYTHRFPMPPPATRDAPWYSFDAGPVHFIGLSTEHALSAASPQLAWLDADLAAAAAANVTWKVLSAHRFFYVDSSTAGRDAAAGRALLDGGLEALLLRYGVDVTLTGHHHSYQRSCTVNNGACVPVRTDGSAAAPVHIVGGHAGAGISGVSGVPSAVSAFIGLEHGYLVGVANATHLVLSSRRSTDATIIDELVLVKPPPTA